MITHFQRAARMSVVERAMLVSNRITMFVKQSILRLSKVGSRVDTIKFFVHTAEVLQVSCHDSLEFNFIE
jgi:hypothetical protein